MAIIGELFLMFGKLVIFFLKVSAVVLIPLIIMCGWFTFLYFLKGKRFKKPTKKSTYKNHGFFRKLLIDFPRRFILDLYNKDPNKLPIYGLHIFAGEQGSGKSMAAVEMMLRMKKKYPLIKVRSNINLKFQDGKIQHWKDLVFNQNGETGQIEFLDELQNWFNSLEGKDFPIEMLQEITQQRKQHKCIIGTSQVFTRVAKAIREQTNYLYLPITIFGCLTIVRVYKPKLDEGGNLKKKIITGLYFFVHDDELRSAYDTFEKVERMRKGGFAPRSEQINSTTSCSDVNFDEIKKKLLAK